MSEVRVVRRIRGAELVSADPTIVLPIDIFVYESGEVQASHDGEADQWYGSAADFEAAYGVLLGAIE